MNKKIISLSHGNGGRLTNELITTIILPAFNMALDAAQKDAVTIYCNDKMMITTDGFTVDPLFFPGGDIGKLAVCGTLNDLFVSGAIPQYLTVNFFIEEGFPIDDLTTIAQSMGQVANLNAVSIVAGDTKVLPKGTASGIHISTTGVGHIVNPNLSIKNIEIGDRIFVTGTLGDHGAAVLLARSDYGLQGNIESDCQSLKPLAEQLMTLPSIKFMRDPTRGGLITVCHEISTATNFGIHLIEDAIPIKNEVNAVCELLGFEPLYLACEGRIVFVTSSDVDISALKAISNNIVEIGTVSDKHQHVVLQTVLGGLRIVAELENEALPRIC